MITQSPSAGDQTVPWRVASVLLFAAWIVTAVLNMRRMHLPFVTTHLADVALPAWLYIGVRGLDGWQRNRMWSLGRWARNPEIVATILFVGATATELSQAHWPSRMFRGRFDPIDILAFAVGIGSCYLADKLAQRRVDAVTG